MNSKQCCAYALSKLAAKEEYPFGPEVIVIKVGGKIFALLGRLEGIEYISLKCSPDWAELLRRQYASITAGYHLNKRHWNTIRLDGSVPSTELQRFIDHSYDLVCPKRRRSKE